MTKARDLAMNDTLALNATEVHCAVTVVRHVDDVFGGETRAVPQLATLAAEADTSQMTMAWAASRPESEATVARGAPAPAATLVQIPSVTRRGSSRLWKLATLLITLLAIVGTWTARDIGQPRASKIAPASAEAVPVKSPAAPVVQAPLSSVERAREEAHAAAALIAGDRALALQRYRRLAAGTAEGVFVRAVRILEVTP